MTITTTTTEILVGKNRHHNTELVRSASQDDLWFHVANKPSPHVILKVGTLNTNTKIPRALIKQCALLCKTKSLYRSEPKLRIHYTRISNLQTSNIPGQVHILDPTKLKTIVL